MIKSKLRELMFVGITDNEAHPRQSRDLFGGSLRIAAGNHNFRFRVLPLHAPDRRSRVCIGGGGNRAGIQHDDGGLCRWSAKQASLFELSFQSGAVGLRSAAPEVLYVISPHRSMLMHADAMREHICSLGTPLPVPER
jgi:hypothetical protein